MASAFQSLSSIILFYLGSLFARQYFSQIETCILLWIALSLLCFIKSSITGNCSQVDEIWSLSPSFFAYHFNNWKPRGIIMFLLIAIWGIRLSFNFWRKGGFSGEEDYRWGILRKKIANPILWTIFNLLFISIYQNFLLMAISLPVFYSPQDDLTIIDCILTIITAVFISIETVADQQQWIFQSYKAYCLENNIKVEIGFLNTGLFKYSRHPNFFAEICIWWLIFSFTRSLNYSIIGVVLLTMLFHGSLSLTEEISSKKYPEYIIYQQNTSRLIPWFSNNAEKVD